MELVPTLPRHQRSRKEEQRGKVVSEETKVKIRAKRALQVITEEHKQAISRGSKGRKLSDNAKLNISLAKRGDKNPAWKGGITPVNSFIRRSFEYALWRSAVLKRDNYQCIWCGAKRKLEADHIKKFADYPELRFATDNGRTLCIDCHKTTDNYGNKNPNRKRNT